ncbi:MAG: ThiF family adenylyltransferase [Candidatus Nanoarchaeia archaeon]
MRYQKQILFREIGKEGQANLKKKTVAILGCGALGSVAAELLARAGIGKLILIDRDIVELDNLHRQSLYTEKDVGEVKVVALESHLKEINSEVKVEIYAIDLDVQNVNLLKSDVILDCTDNFYTRFVVNDYCKKVNLPWVFSSAVGASGFVYPVLQDSPCFRCVFEIPTTSLGTCDTEGVISPIIHSVASLQVSLAFQLLLKKKVEVELIYLNMWSFNLNKIKVTKKKDCPTCKEEFEFLSEKKKKEVVKMCGRELFQIRTNLKLNEIKEGKRGKKSLFLKDITLFEDGRVLIHAKSEGEAKKKLERYFG